MFKANQKTISKPKYPKLKRLQGLMAEYDLTVAQLAKSIGRASSTISKANNGHNLYDSMDMLNIQKVINEKAKERAAQLSKDKKTPLQPKFYTIDDIFYS